MTMDLTERAAWIAVGPITGAAMIVLTDPAGFDEVVAVGLVAGMMTSVALKGVDHE